MPPLLLFMKPYATEFYSSKAWKDCREAYASSKGRLCERCLANGVYRPYAIVHHKTHITPENITDPDVVLNWANLECLCRECHALEHDKRKRRYKVDEFGRVTIL